MHSQSPVSQFSTSESLSPSGTPYLQPGHAAAGASSSDPLMDTTGLDQLHLMPPQHHYPRHQQPTMKSSPTHPSSYLLPMGHGAGGGGSYSSSYLSDPSFLSPPTQYTSPFAQQSSSSTTYYQNPHHTTPQVPPPADQAATTNTPTQPPSPESEHFKNLLLSHRFPDRTQALDWLKAEAVKAGFAVLVRTSRPDYVVLICSCGRRLKTSSGVGRGEGGSSRGGGGGGGGKVRKKKKQSALTGCEWHVILFRKVGAGSSRLWEFRATSKMEHNHPLNPLPPDPDPDDNPDDPSSSSSSAAVGGPSLSQQQADFGSMNPTWK
ncbi:hypothetical protein HDV00_002794 [Rhizophlyctis rosea]|nr:hypothetical protein HDV00_002794 [Rhizophlyctis rosea]